MSLVTNYNSSAVVAYTGKSQGTEQSLSRIDMQKIIKMLMQRVVNSSLKIQFQDHACFRHYGMGDIVVLVGTSNAGKTSIIKALKQLEPDRLEDGYCLRALTTILTAMTKSNKNEIETLMKVMNTASDIPKAIGSTERSWKIGITSKEKIEAEKAIQKITKTYDSLSVKEKKDINNLLQNKNLEMFDDAFEYSRKGRNIIFDVLNIDVLAKHILMRNFDGPMRVVLTYCPFWVLSSRMEERNQKAVKSGELSNQRIGEFPLMQFSRIYTQKGKGQRAFERLTQNQVTQTFDENFDKGTEKARETANLKGEPFPTPKKISKEKKRLRDAFLKNLGFQEGINKVEVAPRNQNFYHLLLNSNQLFPDESANVIHRRTSERYQRL